MQMECTGGAKGSSSGRVCDREKGFGRRHLHPGIVCIARHFRQSFKGKRIRVEQAESLYTQFGEFLAPMGETPESASQVSGHRRIFKYTKEVSLGGAGFVLGPFHQEWKCVSPDCANSILSCFHLLRCCATAICSDSSGCLQPLRERPAVVNWLIIAEW